MFDSLLNRIIVFLSVLVLILGLFIAGLFVPPVFAYSSDSFELLYSDVNAGTSSVNDYTFGIRNSSYKVVQSKTELSDSVYIGAVVSNGSYQLYFFSPSVQNNLTIRGSAFDTGTSSWTVSINNEISDYDFYYAIYQQPFTLTECLVPYYDSFDDLVSFISSVINPSFSPLYDGFNLPRGYMARIIFRDSSVSNNNSITLTSSFGNKSNAITGRFNSSQWYRFINTDLASIVLQYENLGTKISWSPFGHHTTLGQYENGSFSITGSSSTQLWLVNPVYQSYQINSLGVALAGHGLNGVLNNNVVINDPNGIIEQIRIFPLSSGLVAGVDGVVNETDDDSYRDVNGSTSGAFTFTDSDGNVTGSVPQNGATLVDDTTASSLDIINTIKNAFDNLINRLESIFHPAQGFFNTILGSFNDFVHWLSQLWSWLPSPIVGLIEAVLYISILVGCIKLIF